MPPAGRPRALVACASFKGTLSARAAGEALAAGLRDRGWETVTQPLSDGGEGLVEVLAANAPGAGLVRVPCRGPLGERRWARFALLPPTPRRPRLTAVLETAASSGLTLVPLRRRDPKFTTTLGLGDQVREALDRGAREILLGLGGSASNDGGAGLVQALGVHLRDERGRELAPGGAALLRLARVDASGLDARLRRVRVTAVCDVRNPLCGKRGASAVFGLQKGATPRDVALLDRALRHWAAVVERGLGVRAANLPGAGAAGGLGFGCVAFLRARLRPGAELVAAELGLEALAAGAQLVITGEGRLDRTTLLGKAPAGPAARARRLGLACVAVGGGVESGARRRLARLFARVEDLAEFAGSEEEAMRRPALWLRRLARARAEEWQALGGGP